MPLKILLADDSMTAQKMAKEILTTAGYEVTAVSNGAVAAKKLVDKPDIIILDVFMPGYSGLELCEKIRASMDLAKTPVLLTVGKMEPYRAEDGHKVKADGVIVKPFEATDLLAAVKKLADKLAENAKARTKSALHEQTVSFRAPQIIEEFKTERYPESEAPQAPESSLPARLQMSSEIGSAPAYGADLMSEAPAASAPPFEPAPASFESSTAPTFERPAATSAAPVYDYSTPASAFEMAAPASEAQAPLQSPSNDDADIAFAQRISGAEKFSSRRKRNTAEIEAGAAIAAAAASAPEPDAPSAYNKSEAAVDLGSVETQSIDPLLESMGRPSRSSSSTIESPVSSPKRKTEEVQIVPDAGFERSKDSYIDSAQDPALETDATKLATDFPTKFGTSEPEADLEAEPSISDGGWKADAIAAPGYDEGEMATTVSTAARHDEEEIKATDTSSPPGYEDTQKITAPVEVEEITSSSTAGRPDVELANALAAAVGGDAEKPATPEHKLGDETTHRVVTRVLERMLPSIMEELTKEMDAAKKSPK